jgi:hypothetical protein
MTDGVRRKRGVVAWYCARFGAANGVTGRRRLAGGRPRSYGTAKKGVRLDTSLPLGREIIWQEGDQPDPVTPQDRLQGFELRVLRTWLENSPDLRALYQHGRPAQRLALQSAAGKAVFNQGVQELGLRADGLSVHEAQEKTAPALWTPPTVSAPRKPPTTNA